MIFLRVVGNDVDHPHFIRVKRLGLGVSLFQLFDPLLGLLQDGFAFPEHQCARRAALDACRELVIRYPVEAHGAFCKHLRFGVLPGNIVGTSCADFLERGLLGFVREGHRAGCFIPFRSLRSVAPNGIDAGRLDTVAALLGEEVPVRLAVILYLLGEADELPGLS